ncbi:ketopantoate reductase family protein [Pelagibius sp. Alg239-R121]|uniref:ketopantoate reductase family protein n=1 Tax=Pelagibius sp. Alg239-R121 TaxID=2993448 RepID=UPI0024A71070|nr:2-dehydropantoate 2-reductase [Pelagibius sp. Alg239-R121]
MSDWKPKIVVAGAGGMGALFGAILQDGGLDVTLVDTNSDHVSAIRNDGLKISGFGGDRTVEITATTDASDIDHADVILFQCKAHGTRDAARAVRHLVDLGAIAVSFQNGLGNEELIAEELGKASVLGGLTAMAGCMLGPGSIVDFSRVPSYIGEMDGGKSKRAERIAGALSAAGLETHVSGDIVQEIWKKLLGNISLSAISGATDLTSAEILRIPALKTVSLQAIDEAFAVAGALGIALDREAVLQGMELISAPGGTGDNKSSLCVDILNGRPTEVDFIYGSVISKGVQTGVPTPTLNALAAIVKGLESRYCGSRAL